MCKFINSLSAFSLAIFLLLLCSCSKSMEHTYSSNSSRENDILLNVSSSESTVSENVISIESMPSEITSSKESNVSGVEDEILKLHEIYGTVRRYAISGDKIYYSFVQENEEENFITLCIYDRNLKTFNIVAETSSHIFDEFGAYFHENGKHLIYYNFEEKQLGYYDIAENTCGIIPTVFPDAAVDVFFYEWKPFDLIYINGKFFWAETVYTQGNESEILYSYDISANSQKTIYTSKDGMWLYNYYAVKDGLYLKTYPISHCEYDDMMPCCIHPDIGDVLFYDGKKIATVVENVYDFKLSDDGTPLIKKQTYTDNWEKIS